ncbi:40S ribosomal protein SA [Sciurus carolinensis]|uniref:40S ribosomal protein SA n=1 Tax=Sciurus carolinensis TaxID=30640 RepID=A0AA41MMU8_SCICA|nr:40S ribosomal protein SA [Sciurus carolinensis]
MRTTQEKLLPEACTIAILENLVEVSVLSSRNPGHRAVLQFAVSTRVTPVAGHFTPWTYTNQIQAVFQELSPGPPLDHVDIAVLYNNNKRPNSVNADPETSEHAQC